MFFKSHLNSELQEESKEPSSQRLDVLSNIVGFKVSPYTSFSEQEYRFIFFSEDDENSDAKKHYKKKFRHDRHNFQLHKFPNCIDVEFLANYYNIKLSPGPLLRFLKKYINSRHIVLSRDLLEKGVNLGFVFTIYKPHKTFDLVEMLYFVDAHNDIHRSSRDLVIVNTSTPGGQEKVILFLYYDLTNPEISLFDTNTEKLLSTANVTCVVALFEEKEKNSSSPVASSIGDKIKQIARQRGIHYFFLNISTSLAKRGKCLLYHLMLSKAAIIARKVALYKSICIFVAVDDIVVAKQNIDCAVQKFAAVRNTVMSLTDCYPKMCYTLSDSVVFLKGSGIESFMDAFSTKPEKYLLTKVNDAVTSSHVPVSLYSIDDFMPYFWRSFTTVDVFSCPFLMRRLDSPFFDRRSLPFVDVLQHADHFQLSRIDRDNDPNVCVYIFYHMATVQPSTLRKIRQLLTKGRFSFTLLITISRLHLTDLCAQLVQFRNSISLGAGNVGTPRGTENWTDTIHNALCDIFPAQLCTLAVDFVDNLGADIYPFIYAYRRVLGLQDGGGIIIKLHTKTDHLWREELERPVLEDFDVSFGIMQTSAEIGCIHSGLWALKNDISGHPLFDSFFARRGLDPDHYSDFRFVGGTIFMMRKSLMDKFFEDFKISFDGEAPWFDSDYYLHVDHDVVLYAHVWERLVSGLPLLITGQTHFGL